jgi:hypothetical protein
MRIRVLLLALLLAAPAAGQIDPQRRRLIQAGYDQPLGGPGPVGGYLFYYINEPGFIKPDLTLRLAAAPVYLASELGLRRLGADFGLGLEGGGFADSYSEVRHGHYFRDESFAGDGGKASVSIYKQLNPGQRLPVNLIGRALAHVAIYRRNSKTRGDFQLPPNNFEQKYHVGLRLGGVPPRLMPARAAELSIWYEPILRDHAGSYGLNGDRRLERFTQLYWTRFLAAYRLSSGRRFEFSAEAGDSWQADRIGAYRVGGFLPFASEFPLELPGYYNGELSAKRYALFAGHLSGFFDAQQKYLWRTFAHSANVTFLDGMQQPKPWNSGVGVGSGYQSANGVLLINLNYAYGIDAIRAHGRGAHSASLLVQIDLEALRKHKRPETPLLPRGQKPEALDWAKEFFNW